MTVVGSLLADPASLTGCHTNGTAAVRLKKETRWIADVVQKGATVVLTIFVVAIIIAVAYLAFFTPGQA